MKNLLFIAITLLITHQTIAQNYKTIAITETNNPTLNERNWEKVQILDNNENLEQLNSGDKITVSYKKSGLTSGNKKRAENEAIERFKKMAAAKGYPVVKIDKMTNNYFVQSKRKYRIVRINGTGYTYQNQSQQSNTK